MAGYAYDQVLPAALGLMAALAGACERVELAGSVRRGKAEVKDLELITLPRPGRDMFEAPCWEVTMLDEALARLVREDVLAMADKAGPRYKTFWLRLPDAPRIKLDLFICLPPAQFGVLHLIRTGPVEFSHQFVTLRKYGGLLPSNLRVRDGAIWEDGRMIETPTEAEVFEVLGLPFIEPGYRGVGRPQGATLTQVV
jgi:DNA polymerase/3'-5' exonuclease PolX